MKDIYIQEMAILLNPRFHQHCTLLMSTHGNFTLIIQIFISEKKEKCITCQYGRLTEDCHCHSQMQMCLPVHSQLPGNVCSPRYPQGDMKEKHLLSCFKKKVLNSNNPLSVSSWVTGHHVFPSRDGEERGCVWTLDPRLGYSLQAQMGTSH